MRHLLKMLGRFSMGGARDRRGASWSWELDSRSVGREAKGLGGARSHVEVGGLALYTPAGADSGPSDESVGRGLPRSR